MKVTLSLIAQARSGDKGNLSDISLFAKSEHIYEIFKQEVTAERVKEHFCGICKGEVERFEVPNVLALKFVLHDALGGGGPLSIRIDNLGKSLGAALLRMEIDIPEEYMRDLERKRPPRNFGEHAW
ncbi:beta-lactamase [Brevibacillus choshinensis]|uniref:Beta-lactamase n=1 Tax=Brevibacillus choshinensis TaxID=54911 RepID=A0ABR5NDX1_BRECH|nr:hypothetical protein [Brevibacillus choshinensis]KQL49750.1 beta-lactamase [Brevibacillus choshinensis]